MAAPPSDSSKNKLHQRLLRAAFTRFINDPKLQTLKGISKATNRGTWLSTQYNSSGVAFDAPCLVGQHCIEKEIHRDCMKCPLSFNVIRDPEDGNEMDLCDVITMGYKGKYRREIFKQAWENKPGEILLRIVNFAQGFKVKSVEKPESTDALSIKP